MIACDELDGSARNQVSRFHSTAPIRPASTTYTNAGSLASTLTRLDTVFATPWWKMNSATKLKNAAHATALRGDISRVATIVAMLLAASWKPLMTSNASATSTVMTTTVVTAIVHLRSDRG